MEWGLNNPCFGCGGKCCIDVRLEINDLKSTDSFGDLAPHVTNPDLAIPLSEVPSTPGVYYAFGKRAFYLEIIGRCPELLTDGRCGIIKGKRPRGCYNIQPGDGLCKNKRNK